MERADCFYTACLKKKIGRDLQISDETGRLHCTTQGKSTLRGRLITVSDPEGTTMALIRRCTSLILPKYIAELSNGETFTIKRVFSLMPKYEVPEKGWTLDGNGGGMNYLATDGQDREIFRIRHPDQFWPEKFQLRVTGAGLQLPAICTAIAVDAMEEDLRRARKK